MNEQPRKVLVIDDEPSFTQMVRLNLEKSGRYQVQTENDPQRSLETARAFRPELILLDVVMPGMDGGEVYSQIQSDDALRGVPVAFLTATLTDETVRAHHGALGGRPVIAKPVAVKKLVRQIEDILKTVARQQVTP